ncbi:sulfur carrier protein ThiS [Alphaproteobacteria bacterium]|nr:sulfur carrier protein ThiS [Alphaproteobacteria bacterium]
MNIKINGEIKNTNKNTLYDILLENGFSKNTKAIAVALNKCVITKSQWQNQNVKENDKIEIVKPFQGG